MSTVEAHHVSANDLSSTKKLQIHRSFQKKAPAELVAYIKDRIDELEKSMKELREMECTGQNLDVVMEQTSGTAKGGTLYALEITVERWVEGLSSVCNPIAICEYSRRGPYAGYENDTSTFRSKSPCTGMPRCQIRFSAS